jgi:hypothetical protein
MPWRATAGVIAAPGARCARLEQTGPEAQRAEGTPPASTSPRAEGAKRMPV